MGGGFDFVRFHEDVVGVEGREGEDTDAGLGERVEQGGEDTGEGKVEGTFDFEGAPARFLFSVPGGEDFGTNDGEFFGRARDRDETGGGDDP